MIRRRPPIGVDMAGAAQREPMQLKPKRKSAVEHEGLDCARMMIFVPLDTHAKLRDMARERGTSLQQIVATALDKWLLDEGATFGFKPNGGGK